MSCDNLELSNLCLVPELQDNKSNGDLASRKLKVKKIDQAQNEAYQALDEGSLELFQSILKEYPNLIDTKDLSAKKATKSGGASRNNTSRPILCFYAVQSLLRENFDQNNVKFQKKLEILKYIMNHTKTRFIDGDGNTILHFTTQLHCVEGGVNKSLVVLNHLLNPDNPYIKIKINLQNKEGLTPLAVAFKHNDKEKADLLLKNGAHLFDWMPGNKRFLHEILAHSVSDKATAEYISRLLLEHKDSFTLYQLKTALLLPQEASVLAIAASKGHVECLKVFFQHVTANDLLFNGDNLLHMAVERKDIPLIAFLLSQKIEVNALNAEGLTALDINRLQIDSKEQAEITAMLKQAGATEVDVPSYDAPPNLLKLIEKLSQEEKAKMEKLPGLSEQDEKQLIEERSVVDGIIRKLKIKNHCVTHPEDVKRIIEDHPDYYSFVEPLEPEPSSKLFDVLCYKGLDQQQMQMLKSLQDRIKAFSKWIKKELRGLPEPDRLMFAKNQEDIERLLKSKKATFLFGIKWFGSCRLVMCFNDLLTHQNKYVAKLQKEIDSQSEMLMAEWQKMTKELESYLVQSETFYEDQYPGVTFYVESFEQTMSNDLHGQCYCLHTPLYSGMYQEVTLFQKVSKAQQVILDRIQAPFKSVLARNRLGYDLLYFGMEKTLKHVKMRDLKAQIAREIKMERRALLEFKQQMEQFQYQDEKQRQELIDFVQTWSNSLDTLKKRKLERLRSVYELNSKKAGLTSFTQFLLQCKAEGHHKTFRIGDHKLKCLDFRRKDYLFFTNTMPATPDRLQELVRYNNPLFMLKTPFMSASIVNNITKGFAFGHNDRYIIPLLMGLSVSPESLALIGPTDLGSPWNCTAYSKSSSLRNYESVVFIMDCLLARFQLAYSVPQCPTVVLPALIAHAESVIARQSDMETTNEASKSVDSKGAKEESKKRELPPYYRVPEPSTNDPMADMQKANSRWMGSMPKFPLPTILGIARYPSEKNDAYIEAIVKCNRLNPEHAKINVKLLAVEEHYLNEFIRDYQENSDRWDEDYRRSVEESLLILCNISKYTKGQLKFAVIKTDMEGWKSKYSVLTQLMNLQQEFQQLRGALLKGSLQFARLQLLHIQPPSNPLEALNEKWSHLQQKYQKMMRQCTEFEQLIYGRKGVEKSPLLLSKLGMSAPFQSQSSRCETPNGMRLGKS